MTTDKQSWAEGGPIFMNSGGSGPDDYLLRPIDTRQWTKVIFRWGRNYGRAVRNGQVVHDAVVRPHTPEAAAATEATEADRAAMARIFPVRSVCVGDCAKRERRLREAGRLVVMDATTFVAKYLTVTEREP